MRSPVNRGKDEVLERLEERMAQLATRTDMNEGFAEMRAAHAALTRRLLGGLIATIVALLGIVGALAVS